MKMRKTGMFSILNEFLEDTEDIRLDGNVKSKIIIDNLYSLRSEFAKCFPDITRDDLTFVRNLCLVTVADAGLVSMFNGDDSTQEEFISLKKTQLRKMLSKRSLCLLIGQTWFHNIPELQTQPFDF